MSQNAAPLHERVHARLTELGMTVADASRRGKLSKDFIYDLVKGKKKGVQTRNLEKLAFALDCDTGYLLGAQETPRQPGMEAPSRYVIPVAGEVAAGLWIDAGIDGGETYDLDPSPFPADPRFPIEAQFDLIVRGTSINRFAPEGHRLRCVAVDSYPWPILEDDMVVVERFRGDLRERTAKRIRRREGTLELWPDSDDPRWQEPFRVDEEAGTIENGDVVRILGVVLYEYAIPRRRDRS